MGVCHGGTERAKKEHQMARTAAAMTNERNRRALAAEAQQMSKYVQSGGPDDGTVYTRLSDALLDAQLEMSHAENVSDGIIDDIMSALDVRHAYPFTLRLSSDPNAEPTYGRDAFLADVKLAAAASRGKEAAGRLGAAVKGSK